jgi:hypothetical protein
VILRSSRNDTSDTFWHSAEAARDDAPAVLRPLIDGEPSVEVTREEAQAALEWAKAQPGWESSEPKPIDIYEQGNPQ